MDFLGCSDPLDLHAKPGENHGQRRPESDNRQQKRPGADRLGTVSLKSAISGFFFTRFEHFCRNLFILAERFEIDAKSQLSASLDKEQSQPETCSIRMTMGNIYEKVLFFLNHMTHSYIDYSRSESPMSASYECQVPNTLALQRFRSIQQQQQYRRWSEAAATAVEPNETNVDSNRRWSMPTNVSKTQSRFIPMMNKLAGLVNQQSQSTIPDQTTMNNSDGVIEAIQLLSFRAAPSSRPPSQHCNLQTSSFPTQQTQHFRSQPQAQRQRQPRGELNEILILPRASDPLYLGRYQQIAENIRGESDEY